MYWRVPSLPLTLLWNLYLSLCCFVVVQAGFQTVVIDDANGDARTGAMPTYNPANQWSLGPSCSDCLIRPDASNTQDGTWHDTTVRAGASASMSLSFDGPSIEVFCIIPNSNPETPTYVNMNFNLDGTDLGSYQHEPDSSDSLLYRVKVFSKSGLSNSPHTLTITPQAVSVILFDYATYQFGSPDPPPPPPPETITSIDTVISTITSDKSSPAASRSATSQSPFSTTTSTHSSTASSTSTSRSFADANHGSSSQSLSTSLGAHGTGNPTSSSSLTLVTLSTTIDSAGRTSEVEVTITSVFGIAGTSAASTDAPLSNTASKHVNLGLVIGVVAGLLVLAISLGIWLVVRRRKRRNQALVARAWHSESHEEQPRPPMRPMSSSSSAHISTVAISPTDIMSEGSMVRLLPSTASVCSLPSTDYREVLVVDEKKPKNSSSNENSAASPTISRASSTLQQVSTRLVSGASSTLHATNTILSAETAMPVTQTGLSFADELALRERVDMLQAQVQRIVSSAPHAFDEEQPPTYMQARILPHPPYSSGSPV